METDRSAESSASMLDALSDNYSGRIEFYLEELFEEADEDIPERLSEAMFYSLLAGGKRIRPSLCLAAAERCGVSPEKALPMAAAIEFIHTASLIHDDLPCMDNDDFRRGKPTNHKKFGECLALIAGDSLMIWAFGFALSRLAALGVPNDRIIRAVSFLAEASGPEGMCGGQVFDTDEESAGSDPDFVYKIAGTKTAALIRASVVCGAMLGDVSDTDLQCYYDYGTHLGIAFQIVDDILDVTGSKEKLGKTPNKDEAQGKRTFVSVYGLEDARRRAKIESEEAAHALEQLFPVGDLLIDMARSLMDRSY